MASNYPAALDNLSLSRVNTSPQKDVHPGDHNDAHDAINKIEAELGVNPSGTAATVVERLNALPSESELTDLVTDEADLRALADDELQALIDIGGPVGYVVHAADADVARPEGYDVVLWYGSVEPNEGEVGDIWVATGAPPSGGGDGDLQAHTAQTTGVHGISNTSLLVYSNDSRLLPIVTALPKTGAYTVTTPDMGKSIDVTGAATVQITLPAAIGVDGNVFEVLNLGSNPVDIVGSGGVSFIPSTPTTKTITAQGGVARLRRISSTSWHIRGDV